MVTKGEGGQAILDGRWFRNAATALVRTIPSRCKKAFIAAMYGNGFWHQDRLKFDSAVARLNDCLAIDGEKTQFLKISEVWAWMRLSGEHELFLAMAEDLGYRVERIPDETRVQQMLEQIESRLAATETSLDEVRSLQGDIARLRDDARTSSARDATADGGSIRFCQTPPLTF